jgi:hypothetical protein
MECFVRASKVAVALQCASAAAGNWATDDICHRSRRSSLLLTYACTLLVDESGLVCLPQVLPPLLLLLLTLFYLYFLLPSRVLQTGQSFVVPRGNC